VYRLCVVKLCHRCVHPHTHPRVNRSHVVDAGRGEVGRAEAPWRLTSYSLTPPDERAPKVPRSSTSVDFPLLIISQPTTHSTQTPCTTQQVHSVLTDIRRPVLSSRRPLPARHPWLSLMFDEQGCSLYLDLLVVSCAEEAAGYHTLPPCSRYARRILSSETRRTRVSTTGRPDLQIELIRARTSIYTGAQYSCRACPF
jgi:hypothetical protein